MVVVVEMMVGIGEKPRRFKGTEGGRRRGRVDLVRSSSCLLLFLPLGRNDHRFPSSSASSSTCGGGIQQRRGHAEQSLGHPHHLLRLPSSRH